jgi:hypothetical protein
VSRGDPGVVVERAGVVVVGEAVGAEEDGDLSVGIFVDADAGPDEVRP